VPACRSALWRSEGQCDEEDERKNRKDESSHEQDVACASLEMWNIETRRLEYSGNGHGPNRREGKRDTGD
jgi:hypothetical protein